MDKKKFDEFLEQVAEIRVNKPARNSGQRLNEEVTEVIIDGKLVVIDQQSNPTLGFDLVKLKDNNKLCEMGCGKIVSNQVIERRFCYTPSRHWRTRCHNCGKYVHPDGESLIENGVEAAAVFNQHLAEKNK